jgi:hypothetical protein
MTVSSPLLIALQAALRKRERFQREEKHKKRNKRSKDGACSKSK